MTVLGVDESSVHLSRQRIQIEVSSFEFWSEIADARKSTNSSGKLRGGRKRSEIVNTLVSKVNQHAL